MLYYQTKLKNFNKELAILVDEKTKELRKINEHLEESVSQKVLELIQKDEILTLQSKQAIMGEMISMIAHQWRQPLNTITLNISNIQLKHMLGKDMNTTELQLVLDEINKTIVYLSETVDDFKTYFHPDKKKEKITVYEVLHKAVNFILPRVKSESIEIVISKETPIVFETYQNELVQVLLNILNNAIDAYASRETEHKIIELCAESEEETIVIYVKDEAGGIDPSNIKKLFEPYFSTKGKNGTGLGLYMSQMIIQKQFKGDIKVKSSNGATTFKIIIPKVENASQARE
jgi:C4-dicarboxylate-specific signal transduction histidine kinase